MTRRRPLPAYSIWVRAVPKSQRGNSRIYVNTVQAAAGAEVPAPLQSNRIDIEIIFAARDRTLRADVDNVIKPILDALKGIVYVDDRQVRSVTAVALPLDDAMRIGAADAKALDRLFKTDEFLINVFNGLTLNVDIRLAIRPTPSPESPAARPDPSRTVQAPIK